MSHQTARTPFLATMEQAGMSRAVATKILRHAATWARSRAFLANNGHRNFRGYTGRQTQAQARLEIAERLIHEACDKAGGTVSESLGPHAGCPIALEHKHGRRFTPTFTTDPASVTIRVPSGAEVAVPVMACGQTVQP